MFNLTKEDMFNLFYDGFNSKLIEDAFFESFLEIPKLEAPDQIIIPKVAIPFSKRKQIKNSNEEMIVFYEFDHKFREFISVPQNFINDLSNVKIISTPDCSIY